MKEKKDIILLKNLHKYLYKWKINKKKYILKLNSKYGPLRAKAFPGRASILINILKLNKKNIASVHEQKDHKNKPQSSWYKYYFE